MLPLPRSEARTMEIGDSGQASRAILTGCSYPSLIQFALPALGSVVEAGRTEMLNRWIAEEIDLARCARIAHTGHSAGHLSHSEIARCINTSYQPMAVGALA